ncbi:MAG: 50S ribosomal protein L31e [Candidatus Bathyarchaeota archaeon]
MSDPVNEAENEEDIEETEDLEEELEIENPDIAEDEEEFLEAKSRKNARKEKTESDEDIVEERFYTIPLGKAWISTRKKRAPRATRIVKSFVLRHMKIRTEVEEEEEPEKLVIDNEVNEKLWSRGIEKPPRKIRVRVVKDKEGVVTVLLAEGD